MHKKILYLFGQVLSIAGVIFIAYKLWQQHEEIFTANLSLLAWITILLLSITCIINRIFQALGWRKIMEYYGEVLSFRSTLHIYGSSTIAIYLPSNIAQFVSRQILGISYKFAHKSMLKSIIWELAFEVASCVIYLPILTGHFPKTVIYLITLPLISKTTATIIFFLLLLLFSATLMILGRKRGHKLLQGFFFYFISMSLNGTIFICIFTLIGGSLTISEPTLVYSGAIIAFLFGLLTPGSPSGIGVREAVLCFILQSMSGQQPIILAVLLWRVITIIGDIVFFLLAKTCTPQLISNKIKYK